MATATAMKSAFYTVNGIRLHVMEAGDPEGQPVLFLHGFPEHWYGWHKQIDYFAARNFRVIVPDQRGYNLSDKPGQVRAYELEQLTQDIVDLIAQLRLENTLLVGHDWGGIVSWHLATYHPELFGKIVIANVPHPAALRKKMPLKQFFKSWYIYFFQIPRLPEQLISRNNLSMLANSMLKTAVPGTFSAEDMSHYREAWSKGISPMINWYRAMLSSKLFKITASGKHQIRKPLLLIWGKQDAALSFELAPPSLDFCVNARLKTYEDATHWIHHEKAQSFNEDILAFLEEE